MNKKDNLPTSEIENDGIDLLDLIRTALNEKWLIFCFLLISILLALVYSLGTTPIYKANTLLQVETQKVITPGLENRSNPNADTEGTTVGTEIELIKSRKNIAKAIKVLKLDIVAKPLKVPLLSNLHRRFLSPTETNKLPLIWEPFDAFVNKYAWGNEYIKVSRLEIPSKWYNKELTLVAGPDNSYEIFEDKTFILKGEVGKPSSSKDSTFNIFVSELTGAINTQFVITKLSNRRAISSLQNSISAAEKGRNTGIIALELMGDNQETIVKILDRVSETYVEQNKSRSSEEATNALKFLSEQIKPVKEKVLKAQASLSYYQTKNQSADLSSETSAILNVVSSIDAEFQNFSLAKEELSQRYTDQHPRLKTIQAQEKKLLIQKAKIQEKIAKLPKTQQTLLELERDLMVSNTIYTDLLNKIQEFNITKASTVGNSYVVDSADIDETFVRPNRIRVLALGILVGLALGLIAVLIRKSLHKTIDSPEIIEKAMGIPVYATIPFSKNVSLTASLKSKNKKQKKLLALHNPDDPVIESLRSLRTSLHFALHEAKNNIIMFTGPSPGIGKSFISSNFSAVSAATTGKRVILIDADMRKGYLHNLFGLKTDPGLSDIITEKVTLEDAIRTVKVGDESMDIITRGQTAPNPSELLMHNNFGKLLDHLSKSYDLVLIDSPPVLAVTDPTIIGSHAGAVFSVLYSDKHSIREIERTVNHLANSGINTKGFIFNGYVAKNNSDMYGLNYYGEYS